MNSGSNYEEKKNEYNISLNTTDDQEQYNINQLTNLEASEEDINKIEYVSSEISSVNNINADTNNFKRESSNPLKVHIAKVQFENSLNNNNIADLKINVNINSIRVNINNNKDDDALIINNEKLHSHPKENEKKVKNINNRSISSLNSNKELANKFLKLEKFNIIVQNNKKKSSKEKINFDSMKTEKNNKLPISANNINSTIDNNVNNINKGIQGNRARILLDVDEIKNKINADKKRQVQYTLDKYNFKLPERNINKNKTMKELENNAVIKIYSWNVNGLRAMLDKGLLNDFFKNGNNDK